MGEDTDTRKINHSFLRDHSYVTEADIISTVEFNHTGELLATGDKGGRVVIFQREPESKNAPHSQGEYDVYSTFQSHEPEFDYLKSLEIEEKINKIKWLPQQNAAHSLLSTNDKTIKLWKITERDKRPEGYNLKDEEGKLKDLSTVTSLQVPVLKPMDLMVEVSPRRVFANGHTYHINSISVNSDCETYMSADDLRINLWHLAITDRSFNIVDIKPANMEDLTEVITASEFHPHHCNLFVYSSSKGSLRLCDMRAAALCDKHSKLFEEPEDPSNRSFFSEIISSVSDVKFSRSGRYMLTRDYLTVKVWDLNMEARPVETYQEMAEARDGAGVTQPPCRPRSGAGAPAGTSQEVTVPETHLEPFPGEEHRVWLSRRVQGGDPLELLLPPWRPSPRQCSPSGTSMAATEGLARTSLLISVGSLCALLSRQQQRDAGCPMALVVAPAQGRQEQQPGVGDRAGQPRVLVPTPPLSSCVPELDAEPPSLLTWSVTRFFPAPPPSASVIMTGAYNNFFRMFDRNTKRDVTLEASRESSKPRAVLKPRRVCVGGKRRRDDISVDSLDFTKKILHTAWHPAENIIAIAATNNLYIFQDKVNSEMH
ncbi:protein phosphatase 2, regulatory subunit B, gamma [Suricata suricatta]|uniref:protein phosphatase 2, regulatory subunit B, gamma n=1 Tax=Suricata suricatta TaxID=37032 RepID=UPI0011552834|nr:protein phosphatase 2, regulatory subunit B, gamma [Suricata suricatta]